MADDGVRLHFESTGEGSPVLLIMGLGMAATGWWRTVPVLSERLRVLAFDNRGAGRSDSPLGPYTLARMADDAIAVLDAAEVARAHVYGISLGGMIAQEVALRHPHRVERLVLGATTVGGALGVPADAATLAFFSRRADASIEDASWASVPYNYAAATRRTGADRIAQDIAQRLLYPPTRAGYLAQLGAAMGHDAAARVGEITAPTLILHGLEDRMVPPANGRILHEQIAGSHLIELSDAAHLYFTDTPLGDLAARDFLSAPSNLDPSRSTRP